MACVQEVDEQVTRAILGLKKTHKYKHATSLSRHTLQAETYGQLRRKVAHTTRVPRGLMDKALSIVSAGEPVPNAHNRKIRLFPDGRLQAWSDIVRSVFHHCWTRNWNDEEDAAVADPEPSFSSAEEYTTYMAQLQGPADDTGQEEPDDGSNYKSIAIPFNKIVRPDLSARDSGMVLRLLEDAQAGISSAMEELCNLVFCVTLAVAAGWTEPKEHLQLLHCEFLSPQQQSRDTSSSHPLWSSISSLIESQLSDELPKSPEGLSTTITVHIRQAATAIQNHWKGDIYDNSFRYLALALLRVRLAPNRFIRTEKRRRVAAAEKSSGHAVRSGAISKSLWTRRVRDVFNELADLTRKDMPDDKAGRRIEALLLKLRNLRKCRPAKGEARLQPIPVIEEQLRQAQYAALLDSDRSTDSAQDSSNTCMQLHRVGPVDEDEDEQEAKELSDESEDDEGDIYPDDDDEEHEIQTIAHQLDGIIDDETASDITGVCEDEEQGSAEDFADCMREDDESDDEESEDEDDESEDNGDESEDNYDESEEGDNESDDDDNGAGEDGEDERESSGAQVKRLLTVVNTLIHSPKIRHAVNTNYVSKALSKTTKCTAKELRAIRDIVILLRPYAPKRVPTECGYRAHTPCVALQAPMVLLAQAILQALGLHRYTRRLSPSHPQDQALPFNLVFVNRHQVQILGTVIPHGPLRKGQPIKSHYEQRKAAKTPCVSASSHFWQSKVRHHGLGKEQLEDAAEASADIVKKKANDIKAYKRSAASDPEEAYYWSKMGKAIKFMELHPDKVYPPPTKHVVTWKNHQLEEEPARLDTSLLLESVRQSPDLVRDNEGEQDEEQEDEGTMDLTRGDDASMSSVPTDLSRQELLERIRLPKATRVSAKNLQDISFTKRYLETRIKVLEQAKRGKRKKPPDQERSDDAEDQDLAGDDQSLQRAMESTSAPKNSLLCARNMQEVSRISSIRRDAREPLLQLKKHHRLLRLKNAQMLRKKRAKKRVATRLKHPIKDHALASHPGEEAPKVVTAIAYGAAGPCVGGRMGGRMKWGGDWIREHLLWLDMLVAVTDEFCTSQICPYCGSRVQLSTARRVVGTSIKTRKLHGSIECKNRSCISYKCGYGTRPRDTNAATNILISGVLIWISGGPWPITPFCRYIRPTSVPAITTSPPPLEDLMCSEHSSQGVPSEQLSGADLDESASKPAITLSSSTRFDYS
ncbi:unnamed protein product [Mortierella alpina]